MPSQYKRVNLTLDPEMLSALDAWMAAHGYRCRASAAYHFLWQALLAPGAPYSSGGSNTPSGE